MGRVFLVAFSVVSCVVCSNFQTITATATMQIGHSNNDEIGSVLEGGRSKEKTSIILSMIKRSSKHGKINNERSGAGIPPGRKIGTGGTVGR
ncbi:unnamed protein product [Pseudo-nitzschia multistriata]|uniref:RxLR effector protein n=1 Tax=Pseudo-nitzschia multistriata TaxID=183589 RepID=A0A448ZKQ0_9STRA|nr:unnamed protein product [Pseudo-nitzschia multistriata]